MWTPSAERIERAGITRYMQWLGKRFDGYEALWRWSVTDLEAFWASIADFCGVRFHARASRVLDKREMPGARWFEGATLNYAEQSLWRALDPAWASKPAIIAGSESRPRIELTWGELGARVAALAAKLKRLGVRPGDRVAGFIPNIPEAVIALLASASIGAVWSSAAPDMGPLGVLDRFRQIEPRVLFYVEGYRYGGKDFDRRDVVAELRKGLPSVEHFIRADELPTEPAPLAFEPVEFSHPLWVVYSSGTSGMPKAIVQGHGGVVLENLKALALHLDVSDADRFLWFSSTNWIMWNLSAATLMAGCTLLLLDGHPQGLFDFAASERATFLGTSPAWISTCMKDGITPRIPSVRTLGATGAPLSPEAYRWIFEQLPEVFIACISGGTEVCAAFLTSCPTLPVYEGEMQCRALGVDAKAVDDDGREVMDQVGELVIAAPMPSMPLHFWNDPDFRRYRESYFEAWPGLWRHGDWVRFKQRPESVTGIIYGRSDSTIKRHGIRMGTAELYRIVEEFPEVVDALAIDAGDYLALFVVVREELDDGLRERLTQAIRTRVSPRHVPNGIFAVPGIPRTLSGKKMEVPVKKILMGLPLDRAANRDAMANPETLQWFADFAASHPRKR